MSNHKGDNSVWHLRTNDGKHTHIAASARPMISIVCYYSVGSVDMFKRCSCKWCWHRTHCAHVTDWPPRNVPFRCGWVDASNWRTLFTNAGAWRHGGPDNGPYISVVVRHLSLSSSSGGVVSCRNVYISKHLNAQHSSKKFLNNLNQKSRKTHLSWTKHLWVMFFVPHNFDIDTNIAIQHTGNNVVP